MVHAVGLRGSGGAGGWTGGAVMAKRGRPKKKVAAKKPKVVVAELVEPEISKKTTEIAVRQEQQTDIVPSAVDAQALIARAIDKNLPIESMERLLAMRRELRAEWARDQFYTALSRFQKMCPIIGKEKGVFNKAEKGGALRYKYAPLDVIVGQVKDVLDECGFSYVTKTKQTKEDVTAIVEAHHRDGHTEVTEFTVPIDREAYMTAPQKIASALTYATRYAFRNAFGIMTGDEDDDAQSAGDPKPQRNEPKRMSEKATIHEGLDSKQTIREVLTAVYKSPPRNVTPEVKNEPSGDGGQTFDLGSGAGQAVGADSRVGSPAAAASEGGAGADGLDDAVRLFADIIHKLNASKDMDSTVKIELMKVARDNRENPVKLKEILNGI